MTRLSRTSRGPVVNTREYVPLIKPRIPLDSNVWDLALDRTRYIYEQFDHVVVSFSGGKDSTATLMVALEVATELDRLPLDVLFFDEEAIPPETVEYVQRCVDNLPISLRWECLPVRHRNACSVTSPSWYPWAPEVRELWCRDLPDLAITEAPDWPMDPAERPSIPEYAPRLFPPDVYGNTVQLLGLRASESLQRQNAVRKRRGDNFVIPDYRAHQNVDGGWGYGNVHTAYPIYDWTTDDVWRAPARLGWDHNYAYDTMEMLGLTPHQQRCAPPFGEEPIQKLWIFQQAWPELWAKMSERVPGAATAARYGHTVLYGQGAVPRKPDDMPWETFILALLERTEPGVRSQVAFRIRGDMQRHFARTTDPLVYQQPHPETGLHWRFLVNLAIRADLKERRPQPYIGAAGREKAWEKYRLELSRGGDMNQLPG